MRCPFAFRGSEARGDQTGRRGELGSFQNHRPSAQTSRKEPGIDPRRSLPGFGQSRWPRSGCRSRNALVADESLISPGGGVLQINVLYKSLMLYPGACTHVVGNQSDRCGLENPGAFLNHSFGNSEIECQRTVANRASRRIPRLVPPKRPG
jgi:hypothetical protein